MRNKSAREKIVVASDGTKKVQKLVVCSGKAQEAIYSEGISDGVSE